MNITVCAPGRTYSGNFLKHWTMFIGQMMQNGFSVSLSQAYSPNIYYARNMCLGGDIRAGRAQLPFKGKDAYDYILWIDSDNIPSYKNFVKLLSRDVDICAGVYKMQDGRFATVKNWDTTHLAENGEMEFLTDSDFEGKTDLIEVAYTGMGFMLVKKGVFERFQYPYFQPLNLDIGQIRDFTTEDIYFCQKAQTIGYKVFVDPAVRVGHEKPYVI